MKIEIKNDLYDIAGRLHEIDPEYGVVFNTDTQKFEVLRGGEPCLVIPYDNLDQRTLERTLYTRSENILNVLDDLEKENEEAERRRIKAAQDRLENEFSYAQRSAHKRLSCV